MLIVHHLNHSRSQRILWLLEELNVAYEVKRYERDPKTMLAPESLKVIHPLGRAPVIDDNGLILAETGAIIEYLLEKYDNGSLMPKAGTPEFRQFKFWLHYAEGSAMPPLLLSLIFSMLPKKSPLIVKPVVKMISESIKKVLINPDLKLHLDFMENEIAKTGWFAGREFSAADVQMSFPIEAAKARGHLAQRPHLQQFLKAIHARPAYQNALNTGGPYAYGQN